MRFYNPENFKQGQLLINRYYPKELAILIGSIITSVVLTVVIGVFAMSIGNKLLLALMFILALIPVGAGFVLLNPLEGYHNAYQYFKLKIAYKGMQKKYMWEGVQYDDSDEYIDEYE
ncbi:hypothetical protein [Erysipelothrix aquatica]|uniref:hypothetical protein n=1 Tax=Erysipelothrix aquatica TaxID=2683714 RepID=UPI00135C7D15|nr:hypothetical protein [Erysipelothrix aquatica]